ncbi:MAG TPA: outer membrane protein assembly factor BamB [Burkholderiaceae bacterium]
MCSGPAPGIGGRASAGVLAAALLLAACASSSETAKPAPLPPISAPIPVRVAWHVALGDGRDTFLRPAVLENAVFAAGEDGEVVRVEPGSGKVAWRVKVTGPLGAGVGSDGFTVAVAGTRGQIYAFGADGNRLWEAQVTSPVLTPPLVGHDLVLVRSTDQHISAFDASTGKRRWVFQKQQPPLTLRAASEMVFSGDSVLVGFPGGRLTSIALSNGAARWEAGVSEPKGATEVERLSDVIGVPAIDGREVCAGSYQGRIACFDAASGDLRWARDIAAGAGVAAGDDRVYGVDGASHVYCLALGTGAPVWQNPALSNRALTTPAVLGKLVAVGDFQGYVHFLAASDGSFVGRLETDGSPMVAAPQPWAGGVIVQSQRGELALMRPGA